MILVLPGNLTPEVSFTLHVRDLSRQHESWGAEVPVVKVGDFLARPASLTNIPVGTDYRQTLRLYAIPTGETTRFRLKLYTVTEVADVLVNETTVVIPTPGAPPPNALGSPSSQATVTDIFMADVAGSDRAPDHRAGRRTWRRDGGTVLGFCQHHE